MTMEYSNLQSTVETIYRVNADEQARAEILAREKVLLEQRTLQDLMKQKDATIAIQQQTLDEKDALLSEQADTIAKQMAEIAALKAKLATLNK